MNIPQRGYMTVTIVIGLHSRDKIVNCIHDLNQQCKVNIIYNGMFINSKAKSRKEELETVEVSLGIFNITDLFYLGAELTHRVNLMLAVL